MVGLTLLREATSAGLTVKRGGDRLIVRGPKQADAVARRLLAYKADVLAALAPPPSSHSSSPSHVRSGQPYTPETPLAEHAAVIPSRACRCCGNRRWWRVAGTSGLPTCGACHPPVPNLDVETCGAESLS